MDGLVDNAEFTCQQPTINMNKLKPEKAKDACTRVTTASTRVTDNGSTYDDSTVCWESFVDLKVSMDTDNGTEDVYPFQDLFMWRDALQKPLYAAQQCMNEAEDQEMVEAVGRTVAQAQDLVDNAVNVLVSFAKVGNQASKNMLPFLYEARAKRKRTRAANTVGVAQGVFVDLRKQAASARSLYLDMLEQVRYMVRCNLLGLDYWAIKFEESEGKISMDQPEFLMLHRASIHLDSALTAMENCSVFWLLVHSSELKLESLKSMAHILRNELVNSKDHEWPTRFGHFCTGVEQFCEQYKALNARCGQP